MKLQRLYASYREGDRFFGSHSISWNQLNLELGYGAGNFTQNPKANDIWGVSLKNGDKVVIEKMILKEAQTNLKFDMTERICINYTDIYLQFPF